MKETWIFFFVYLLFMSNLEGHLNIDHTALYVFINLTSFVNLGPDLDPK